MATPESNGTSSIMSDVADLTSGESVMALRIVNAMKKICRENGGPRQYLQKRWSDTDQMGEFYTGLLQLVPPDPAILYHESQHIPEILESEMGTHHPLILHPAMFSFANCASVKGPPESNVVEKLVDQIVMDGFASTLDRLLITPVATIVSFPFQFGPPVKPVDGSDAIGAFSLGYVKGQARMHTLLCILSLAIEDNIDLERVARPPMLMCACTPNHHCDHRHHFHRHRHCHVHIATASRQRRRTDFVACAQDPHLG